MAEKEEEIDDTIAGDAADTVAADADDTVAADAAQDTVVADAADDTLAGDAGDKSPFEEFGEPTGKKEEPKAALEDTPADERDALDKRLEAAEAKLDVDPFDAEAAREHRQASKAVRLRDAARLKVAEAQSKQAADAAAYARFTKLAGLDDAPAEVRRKLTRDVIDKRFSQHLKAAYAENSNEAEAIGYARANLRHEIKAIIAAAGKPKSAPKTNRTAGGASLTPPGGVGGRPGKAEVKPDRVFIDNEWAYPTPIGES